MRPSSAIARSSPSGASSTSISSVGSRSWAPVSTAPRARKRWKERVRVGRIGDERADVLQRGAGVAGLLGQLARRAGLRRFARIDHSGRQFEHDRADAVLVLVNEDDALVRREREDDAKAARLAHEIIVDDLAVRQFDPVGA